MNKKITYSIVAGLIYLSITLTASAYTTYNYWQGNTYYAPGRVIVQYPIVYPPPGGVYSSWNSPYSSVNSPYSGAGYNSWNYNQGWVSPQPVVIINQGPSAWGNP